MEPKKRLLHRLVISPIQWMGFQNMERFLKSIIPAILFFGIYPHTPREVDMKKKIFDHVAIVTGHRQPREQKFKDECNMQLCPDSVSLDKLCSPLKAKCSLVLDN